MYESSKLGYCSLRSSGHAYLTLHSPAPEAGLAIGCVSLIEPSDVQCTCGSRRPPISSDSEKA